MLKRIGTVIGLMISLQATADAEFDQWMDQQSSEFTSYQEAQDSAFSSFLNKEWQLFQVKMGQKRDKTPKPLKLPVAPKPVVKKTSPDLPKKIVSVKKRLEPLARPIPKRVLRPIEQPSVAGEKINVPFLGSILPLYLEKRVNISIGHNINNKVIANFWNSVSSAPSQSLLKQLKSYRKTTAINDWGMIQLIEALANKLYNAKSNEARLFSWYLLVKLDYDARVGYSNERIHLLLPFKTQLFGMPYFTYDGVRYYVITSKSGAALGSLSSYKGSYPSATKRVNLYIKTIPILKPQKVNKKLTFNYAGKQHNFGVSYDKNITSFFENYPSTQLDVYFKSTISDDLKRSLLIPLGKLVEGKSEEASVNLLLRFVQTAFAYKTDGDQFGREKYFFPEELFLYEYSDCEDRSVLFSYLVKELLGLDVVALTFPGHVATAVQFNSDVSGVKVRRGGREYVVADPTYINATVGMVMPQFKNVQPKIISINDV
jgi:hypothetical protein